MVGMTTGIRPYQRSARGNTRAIVPGEMPIASYEAALGALRRRARPRAGMVCGVVIAALAQFVPNGGVHGLLPALVIAAVAFPLVSWAAKRGEARLKLQYGIRCKR